MADVNLNALWARALLEELHRGGVRHAVICPGSRSSPLALACERVPGLRTWSVIDERSAGFLALGMAKASGVPTVLVATSGTAGAHFYPAVIEAAMAGVPLVVLTADRPLELQGWGAPQTVPQARLFGEFARFIADTGLPEASTTAALHLRATAARAVQQAQRAPHGAVHLNVPFREPLAPTPQPFDTEAVGVLAGSGRGDVPVVRIVSAEQVPDTRVLAEVRARLERTRRGVIVCGPRDADDGFQDAVLALSRASGFPVLAEPTSQVRFGAGDAVIAHSDAVLRHAPFAGAHVPELVLRFGGGLTPRTSQQWLERAGADVVVFSEGGQIVDPSHMAALVVEGSAVVACRQLAEHLAHEGEAWSADFVRAERIAGRALEDAFRDDASLTEPRVAREVAQSMPQGANLFVSSSMPIRDLDAFAPAGTTAFRALANRGANGIDGVLSSAVGVAAETGKHTVVLTGDLAFLHDVGGLLTAARCRVPLTVVVVNNDGGGIFSFLPIASADVPFERHWGTPHGLELGHAASLFGARFHQPRTPAQLREALGAGRQGGLHVIEVRTERDANVEVHRRLFGRVAEALERASL
ncbi:MAG: 2-succinyl-5-enolpyruvyl-6-hydroxy-3-cyclohexene-1-carboxylic-acid synthase [Myxococcaceae bacterium]|nr:2-succinyl-5-enolpyruvyl-6-hydroxy-3-cyclohexene-1-carboxylic-acid synthase [Myxococcaceae bacterium]MCI0669361.1 2-succinyl-5-enolpyruvyl-6-hydroxy-3-cyclohexene-1-carboxylic-acid synthase [Myxococcaceae bacterium]